MYVAWEVLADGPRVRNPIEGDSEHLNGVGFFKLGNDLTPLGLISGVGFDEAIWFNARIGQWIAGPGSVGNDANFRVAQYIRWSISPMASVHFYVFGDA